MFFGFLAWMIRFKESIIKHDKKTIFILATAYTLISGLVASSTALYLLLEMHMHPVLSSLFGSITALFTKMLMQRVERNILRIKK